MKKPGVAQGLLLAGAATTLGAIIGASTSPAVASDPNATLAGNIGTAIDTKLQSAEGGALFGALSAAAVGIVVLSQTSNLKRAAAGTLIGAGSLAFGALLLQAWPKTPATVA